MRAVIVLSLAYLACIVAAQSGQQLLERIEKILKPTSTDTQSKNALYERINKAEKVCKVNKCKVLHEQLKKGGPVELFSKLMKEYDECMDECRVKEQRSFDKLREIEKKSDYWKNFNEVKVGMSVADAIVYWTEIRGEFKLLEEEQLQMENIERILKPSEADQYMRDELRKRVHKAEKTCKEGKCKKLQEQLVAGSDPDKFIELMKAHDECMKECREKEQRSLGLLSEIDKKADFWKNFNEVKDGLSLEDALVYWTEIEDEFKLLRENEQEFERIERILKPSEADKNMRTELQDEIKKARNKCAERKCTKDVSTKEKWAHDLLEEIEKKSDFWKNTQEVRDVMSTLDALVYWTEIRDEFKILEQLESHFTRMSGKQSEKQQEKIYEDAMAKLRLTKEEIARKEQLDTTIREQDRVCKTGKCADSRKAILEAEKSKDQVSAADKFFDCMKQCKSVVDKEAQELDKLHEREDYYKNMQEVREQVSIIAAVQYYDEIKSDIEAASKDKLPAQQELVLRKELDEHIRNASTHCLVKECASIEATGDSLQSKLETSRKYIACLQQCKKDEKEFEQTEKLLELTQEELELKRKLEHEVAEASLDCQKTECADLKTQMKNLGFQNLDFNVTNAYFNCLEVCKQKVKEPQAKIDELRSRQQYLLNMQSIRDEMSLQHALIYWVEIKDDVILK